MFKKVIIAGIGLIFLSMILVTVYGWMNPPLKPDSALNDPRGYVEVMFYQREYLR